MKKQKEDLELETLIENSISNIEQDRSYARILLIKITEHLLSDVARNKDYGMVAAKYLETLQRSNEQLVKLVEIKRKQRENENEELSEEETENLFNQIQSEKSGDDK